MFEPENFASLLAVPPVVVTVEVASGEMAGAIAAAVEALAPARTKGRGGQSAECCRVGGLQGIRNADQQHAPLFRFALGFNAEVLRLAGLEYFNGDASGIRGAQQNGIAAFVVGGDLLGLLPKRLSFALRLRIDREENVDRSCDRPAPPVDERSVEADEPRDGSGPRLSTRASFCANRNEGLAMIHVAAIETNSPTKALRMPAKFGILVTCCI